MAEWSIAAVLKTVELRGSGGSNPSLSANDREVGWGSSVGRGKAGRNSIFVLSVGSWEKLLSGVSKSTTR